MSRVEHIGSAVLHLGDCLAIMPTLQAESIHAIITDPPYGIGFMGKAWDHGVPGIPFWQAALRVLKPGGHLIAFGGSRTYHRIACAIEDAGFEIRDSLMWLYSSGFPKSFDISKAIDKAAGAVREVVGTRTDGRYAHSMAVSGRSAGIMGEVVERQAPDITLPATPEAALWAGWGSALKPAFEPIILARKPLDGTLAANTLRHGVGGLNIDACRSERVGMDGSWGSGSRPGGFGNVGADKGGSAPCGERNALGRFPANVLHDGSDEVMAAFAAYGERTSGSWDGKRNTSKTRNVFGDYESRAEKPRAGDTGSAARFFYSAKANLADRADSKHPTVKPQALMSWLCRLITPPGGTILDPFCGTGSTLLAADRCGFKAIGIEMDPTYAEDARRKFIADAPLFVSLPPVEDPADVRMADLFAEPAAE